MEKQTKMQRGRKIGGGEERKRSNRQRMGSLSAATELCPVCGDCFPTLRALWGHQNAHRAESKLRRNKKKNKKVVPEEGAGRNNDDETIDLELRVGSGCPAYPKFYNFMGVQEQGGGHAASPSASAAVVNDGESAPIVPVDVSLRL